MGKRASHIDRILRQVLMCLLLVIGIVGIFYSVKCLKSQFIYVQTKYGITFPPLKQPATRASDDLWDRHYDAYSYYPHNYYMHSYAAREAIDYAKKSADDPSVSFDEFKARAHKALFFSKLAIQINPYDEESRLMYQEALVLNGKIQEAVEYWEKIVDLEYWNRANHVIMAELYLKSNNISLAVGELPHLPNSELKTKLLKYKKLLDKRERNNK